MLNSIVSRLKKRKSMVQYLRDLGVKIGENCEIYSSASFGSEPYLIKIGNHVRINTGVKFVTHDGGVWVLRGIAGETTPEIGRGGGTVRI